MLHMVEWQAQQQAVDVIIMLAQQIIIFVPVQARNER